MPGPRQNGRVAGVEGAGRVGRRGSRAVARRAPAALCWRPMTRGEASKVLIHP